MPATRLQIKNALQNPYDRVLFAKEVLKPIFGSGFNLLNTMIDATEKPNLSESKVIDQVKIYANIKLEDDTEITCYEIVLQPTVRIERSKVIIQRYIRKLLTSGQAALVNFITPVDNRIWRLTLIAKDSILTDDSIEERYTNAKRYTYLVGPSENCRTVAERLEILSFEKKINFDALINAFSVEKLNKAFYKDITEQFYQLIGATTGIGKNSKVYERALILPNIVNENNRRYQEFAVRLIGRTVFCWFLKVKKSEAGISLLPEHLLSSVSVRENPNYYHNVLEKLFFQTLNTPNERRILDLPKGSEYIPFLNGGLFEAQSDDYYKFNETTNLSSNVNSLTIPDQWFIDFFEKLEQYNFTIDENSVLDVEVSVDPEMLGSIFENLLAEIDPDSGETARKATGSFYTPREVVDYMATESLVYYLHTDTKIVKDRLELIFNIEGEPNFDKREEHAILASLDKLKILDPACGSGAFPMGILQKIVLALQKLDRNGEWWIEQQVSKNSNPIAKLAIREKLQKNPDYARKIGIIQNSLYGVDIQPIAAEISKLRCFLTLIVDEHIDESKPNRGVEPLPNLEFKFVTADTLLKLPDETLQVPMYNAKKKKNPLELLDEIQQVRLDYLESFGDNKQILKEKFHDLQKEIFDQQGLFGSVENNRAYKISIWNPFSHDKTDWFDPQWMFGIKEFNIVVGNPPYKILTKNNTDKTVLSAYLKSYGTIRGASSKNLYIPFIERSIDLLSFNGFLSLIVPEGLFITRSYIECVQYMNANGSTPVITTFTSFVFDNAVTGSLIFIFGKNGKFQPDRFVFDKHYNLKNDEIKQNNVIKKIASSNTVPLGEISSLFKGMVVAERDKVVGTDTSYGNDIFLLGKSMDRWKITKKFYTDYETLTIIGGTKKKSKHSVAPRILIRRTGDKLCSVLIEKPALTESTLYSCWSTNENFDNYFLLALLNSDLLTYFIRQKMITNKQAFPQILMTDLELLPIIIVAEEVQNKTKTLVSELIRLRAQEKLEKCESEISIEKHINILIYKMYDLDFSYAKEVDPNLTEVEFNSTSIVLH
ncbi:Eco57I restriction-modification methylase domain-containing protein [Mucilaginibacter sp. NFX135]|uniref:Eco57I restriction-modification methylase domain-containing protein n=1 Tax=Mucilaginibacter sp. NFX135 TaxID=3402687 RepID=UPI003AFA3EAC